MGKNIVIISSSPRKGGNSDMLCDQFAKGAAEAGNNVEKISLSDLTIHGCRGCYACRDSHKCFQEDDARPVINKMMTADIIVLASPIYFYSICSQLKALIDRSVVVYPMIADKKFFFILTMADHDANQFNPALATLRGFMECCERSTEIGNLCCPGVYDMCEVKDKPEWQKAYQLGLEMK